MERFRLPCALTACLLLFSLIATTANGAIVSVDSSFGSNTITRDTGTGLDWLDLTVTRDQSYNTVLARISQGDLQGWTYATGMQFDALIGNFGGQSMGCIHGLTAGNDYCGWSAANNGVVAVVLSYIGDLYGRNQSIGLLGDPYIYSSPQGIFAAELNDYNIDLSATHDEIWTYQSFKSKDYQSPWVGSFLVRPSEVPIPAAAWLFGSGLIGLIGLARRKVRV